MATHYIRRPRCIAPLTDLAGFIKVRRLDPADPAYLPHQVRKTGEPLPVSVAKLLLVVSIALAAADAGAAATYPFTYETLLADAKNRAAAPYSPQRSRLPAGLDKLSPEQYRSVRFNPDAGIWRTEQLP